MLLTAYLFFNPSPGPYADLSTALCRDLSLKVRQPPKNNLSSKIFNMFLTANPIHMLNKPVWSRVSQLISGITCLVWAFRNSTSAALICQRKPSQARFVVCVQLMTCLPVKIHFCFTFLCYNLISFLFTLWNCLDMVRKGNIGLHLFYTENTKEFIHSQTNVATNWDLKWARRRFFSTELDADC